MRKPRRAVCGGPLLSLASQSAEPLLLEPSNYPLPLPIPLRSAFECSRECFQCSAISSRAPIAVLRSREDRQRVHTGRPARGHPATTNSYSSLLPRQRLPNKHVTSDLAPADLVPAPLLAPAQPPTGKFSSFPPSGPKIARRPARAVRRRPSFARA
eukprot:scaffold15698_cov112-Isochrysis_galbana.AAC.1